LILCSLSGVEMKLTFTIILSDKFNFSKGDYYDTQNWHLA
jgi:hypothetical protein